MLDKNRTPDASYLREKAITLSDVSAIFARWAFDIDAEAKEDVFLMQSAMNALADMAKEIETLAEIVDGYAFPSEYGFKDRQ